MDRVFLRLRRLKGTGESFGHHTRSHISAVLQEMRPRKWSISSTAKSESSTDTASAHASTRFARLELRPSMLALFVGLGILLVRLLADVACINRDGPPRPPGYSDATLHFKRRIPVWFSIGIAHRRHALAAFAPR
ncbi:hypothetical protein P154DRAFT_525738 [Amniculicola lignicola CBS 123094]|uniref:Uncharacterized protein n=1 Tax=Amniculicola lignicola CBS 123094 TaxID=1392246 RepID=A0A6A5WET3_9PLEO|nr:hypothetical protein P154DRAFT_525738 [Amniculicola lignicola CBS 123094]